MNLHHSLAAADRSKRAPQRFQTVIAASLVIESGIGPLVRFFNEASRQHSFLNIRITCQVPTGERRLFAWLDPA